MARTKEVKSKALPAPVTPPTQPTVPAAAPVKAAPKPAMKKGRPLGSSSNGKKRHSSKKESFSIYIHKVLKDVHQDNKISTKAMAIMNSFCLDVFERLASEAARLRSINKSKTVSARDIQTAVRLILPGELSKHAVSEGTKAVTKYAASKS